MRWLASPGAAIADVSRQPLVEDRRGRGSARGAEIDEQAARAQHTRENNIRRRRRPTTERGGCERWAAIMPIGAPSA
eukprot:6951672-Pyramimonas_sp.AAC.1